MKNSIDISRVLNNEEGLTDEECKLRLDLINRMVDLGRPLTREDISDFDLSLVKSLEEKFKVVEQEGDIVFIYPVSSLATSHKIYLDDGRSFYSMCGIDSLGSHFTFKENLTIKSKCSMTGQDIEVRVEDGKIVSTNADDIHVIHVQLDEGVNWSASC